MCSNKAQMLQLDLKLIYSSAPVPWHNFKDTDNDTKDNATGKLSNVKRKFNKRLSTHILWYISCAMSIVCYFEEQSLKRIGH